MNRKQIVAGNWKMNKTYQEGRELTLEIVEQISASDVEVVLCPPFVQLMNLVNITKDVSNVYIGAQNCHEKASGAYTGEISADMLVSVGVQYVILGHSERRMYFNEDDALLAAKVDIALDRGLIPIFCCGESLDIREKDEHVAFVAAQLKNSLFHLDAKTFGKIVIAYEPIWAIGTGVTASPEQAQEMHKAIRDLLADQYGEAVAQATTILYGGSVKPTNAKELFGQADVDGGLVGGASLDAADFAAIVNSY